MHDAEEGQREVIAFLSDPAAHGGAAVERVDTHISRIFLAGDRAWKLKRALATNYLDFSTLEPVERDVLSEIAREGPRTRAELSRALGRPEEDLDSPLYGLSMLGYLAREGEGYRLANWFFERWLRRRVTSATR